MGVLWRGVGGGGGGTAGGGGSVSLKGPPARPDEVRGVEAGVELGEEVRGIQPSVSAEARGVQPSVSAEARGARQGWNDASRV